MKVLILGGGPTLSEGLELLGDRDNITEYFIIATNPLVLSNLHFDVLFYEEVDEVKLATFGVTERSQQVAKSRMLKHIRSDKLSAFQPGEWVTKSENTFIDSLAVAPSYGSRFSAITFLRVLRGYLRNLVSSRVRLYLMRSSIFISLNFALHVLKAKDITVVGFSPDRPGYFFHADPSLLDPRVNSAELVSFEESAEINRGSNLVMTIMKHYCFIAGLFGVSIKVEASCQ